MDREQHDSVCPLANCVNSPDQASVPELVYSLLGVALWMRTTKRRVTRSELAVDEVTSFVQIDSIGLCDPPLYNEYSFGEGRHHFLVSLPADAVLEGCLSICQ